MDLPFLAKYPCGHGCGICVQHSILKTDTAWMKLGQTNRERRPEESMRERRARETSVRDK